MTTAFFTDDRFARHTLDNHPEYAGRLIAVKQQLSEAGLLDEFMRIEGRETTREELLRVHTDKYLQFLEQLAERQQITMIGADTYFLPETYTLARLASGGLLNLVDAVLTGQADNGLATIRPPGHHATPDQAMGFCLLNNIALAARHARQAHQLQRVAIVDFDVHHGNGTQDVFYDDPAVLFVSTHESPLYPGTGALDETGTGEAEGTTINLPLRARHGDEAFKTVYQRVILPALQRFEPQLILISAGFDAHWRDPLARLNVSLTGFAWIIRTLIETAQKLCEGKIIFVMEGGYDLTVLGHGWLNVAQALLGKDHISDPLGKSSQSVPLQERLLDWMLKTHHLD